MAQEKDQPTPKQGETKDEQRNHERRSVADRRSDEARRQETKPVSKERRSGVERRAPEERRKVERRINEYVLKPEVLEFINAVNEFKTRNQKPFPTWTEIFEIFTELGYRKKQD